MMTHTAETKDKCVLELCFCQNKTAIIMFEQTHAFLGGLVCYIRSYYKKELQSVLRRLNEECLQKSVVIRADFFTNPPDFYKSKQLCMAQQCS